MADDIEIKSVDRGYGKMIKVKIATWKENKYVDIREYYTNDDAEELPTKKGVRFSVDTIDEFVEALQEAKKQLED